MRKMKDSGIEWIGEIPENWDTIRVKHLATEKDTLFLDGDWINSDVIVDEGIRYLTSGNVGEGVYKEQGKGYISEETFNKLNCLTVYPGDLMISRLNEPVGRCCIVPEGEKYYVVAVDNVILRPNHNFHKKYLLYCMNTTGYARAALMAASGTTMQRISRTSLGNMAVPVASYEEQFLIADYLDQKCAEIDAIISAKEKTNELLKERRQSIIYEAVTKGLDPTEPMKDSGIEWIGEIPESWNCKKIKYAFSLVAGATPKSGNEEYWDGDIIWITPADYTTEDIYIYEGHKTITTEGLNSCATTMIPEESIVFSKRAPIGLVAINKVPLCTNQGCISCIPNKDIDSKFYYYVMSAFTKEFDLFGSGTTFKEISAEAFANFVLPNTRIEEQIEIAEYLDLKCQEINDLISSNNATIEKLKEYRQSVIYEAVTGKVEI